MRNITWISKAATIQSASTIIIIRPTFTAGKVLDFTFGISTLSKDPENVARRTSMVTMSMGEFDTGNRNVWWATPAVYDALLRGSIDPSPSSLVPFSVSCDSSRLVCELEPPLVPEELSLAADEG